MRGAPRRRAAAYVTVQDYFYQKDISDTAPETQSPAKSGIALPISLCIAAPRDAVGAGAAPSARLLG